MPSVKNRQKSGPNGCRDRGSKQFSLIFQYILEPSKCQNFGGFFYPDAPVDRNLFQSLHSFVRQNSLLITIKPFSEPLTLEKIYSEFLSINNYAFIWTTNFEKARFVFILINRVAKIKGSSDHIGKGISGKFLLSNVSCERW